VQDFLLLPREEWRVLMCELIRRFRGRTRQKFSVPVDGVETFGYVWAAI
jgi:hypothetical protein